MTRIVERTVLFADLRGSTSLYERLGNAEATSVVTHTVGSLGENVSDCGGQVVKTLGDGLMATFDTPAAGVRAAMQMHEALELLVRRGSARGASAGLRALKLQVALARGEVVEMGGDCFGDAVNVAARLLDHAGDNETLITDDVFTGLPTDVQARFRSLDWMHLRGRAEPVHVHLLGGKRAVGDVAITAFGTQMLAAQEPEGIRLSWQRTVRLFASDRLPMVLGRSPQSAFCVDDSRVSRQHARLDWHAGVFSLTDLSINGTYVRFAHEGEVLSLKRGSCTLHGTGVIGLGGMPDDSRGATVKFEVVHFGDTQPITEEL
ncbi:MAG TPA: adenylate/guanylate cyclase domain-containing protein [Burkholderiaceae bacterium]|nr:adenylate/guanylate cyclase domain-containing protein [Burkholderiaceae bacterium]